MTPAEHSGPASERTPGESRRDDHPDPLTDEIAKDRHRAQTQDRRRVSSAVLEVRLRRLALGLLILIPLVWWLVHVLS